ncbi:MAG: hypothetical protein AB7S74_19225 [Hyphomicrobium sp.]
MTKDAALPIARPEPDWQHLFPEIAAWIKSSPQQELDGASLALSLARADAALALAEFCWPSFVVINDMVLRGYSDHESLLEAVAHWMEVTHGDRGMTERLLNHEHFWHLVQSSLPTPEAVMHWAALVREMWLAKLARDFPERRFEVALRAGLDVDLMDHEITFWQIR